jgi:hypothetical protein
MHCVLWNLSSCPQDASVYSVLSQLNPVYALTFVFSVKILYASPIYSICHIFPVHAVLVTGETYKLRISIFRICSGSDKRHGYKKCVLYLYKHIQFSLERKNASWVGMILMFPVERCMYSYHGCAQGSWRNNRIEFSQAEPKTRQGTAYAVLQLHSTDAVWQRYTGMPMQSKRICLCIVLVNRT